MRKRTKLAVGAGAALAAVGAGAAVGATKLSPSKESEAIVEDAAKQLGVTPEKLSDALTQAFENRIDEAVEDGTLSAEAAERLKERLEAGDMPLVLPLIAPGMRGFGFGHHGPKIFRFGLDTAADYLGVTREELRDAMREGKTLAEVAEAEGKSVDGLVDALVADQTERLDEAVKDGRLTKKQRDEIVAGLEERVQAMVEAEPFRGMRGFGPRFRHGHDELPARDA
jgi:lipoate-protein ligase A